MPHAYSDAASHVTISQGFCFGTPSPKQRLNDYLHLADGALYDVKNSTKNSFKIVELTSAFHPSTDHVATVS